jgi:lauroyl/myristoyl acyltransferase
MIPRRRRPTGHTPTGFGQSQRDLLRVVGFGLAYVPSAVIPRRLDPWLVDHVTGLALRLRPGKVERLTSRMSHTLAVRSTDSDLTEQARGHYQMVLEGAWARARNLHARGWEPTTTVEGLERLQAAQAAGRGAILWRMSFGSSLIVKIGLWRAGVPLVHLSMENHGASSEGWIARNVFGPLYRRMENRYLRERVVIPRDGSTGAAMKTLLQRLSRDNAVVSIIGDVRRGAQNITTPFFDAQAQFATGSPSLAWKAGSALFPVYSVREAAGRYRIVIDEPIGVDRQLDRKEYAKRAVEVFSTRMQAAIVRHPGSWSDWGLFWARGSIYQDAAAPRQPPAKIIA